MKITWAITAVALIAFPARAEDLIGFVGLSGPAPAPAQIPDSKSRGCGDLLFDPTIAVGQGGVGLQNVMVWVDGELPPAPTPSEPLVIDQSVCKYIPRVAVALPGQRISVKNSQNILHNVHAKIGKRTLFNKGQPAGTPPIEMQAKEGYGGLVMLGCDIHPWMRSYIHVLPHRFAAVSAQDGSFTIKGLPPGQYTVRSWHEKLGRLETEVTITAGSSGHARLTYQIEKRRVRKGK